MGQQCIFTVENYTAIKMNNYSKTEPAWMNDSIYIRFKNLMSTRPSCLGCNTDSKTVKKSKKVVTVKVRRSLEKRLEGTEGGLWGAGRILFF